jgi:hypothetical protein
VLWNAALISSVFEAVGKSARRCVIQRQEGSGIGNDVRLHERNNALKGEPQEWIRNEIMPAGSGRIKAPGGCENLEVQAIGLGKPDQRCRCPVRGNAVGEETSWEEP